MSDFQVALLILGILTAIGIVVAIVRAIRRRVHLHDAPRRIMMLQHEGKFAEARKLSEEAQSAL